MNLSQRTDAFLRLGNRLRELAPADVDRLASRAGSENSWFTPASVALAIRGIAHMLHEQQLVPWTSAWREPKTKKIIGIAAAGNIPLVGFHDVLCVLLSGHNAKVKLSSQDRALMTWLLNLLMEIEPRFKNKIDTADLLKNIDAAIATGSDNTARYFEYYFRNTPHIIRKNRSSAAIILGEEEDQHLISLGHDVFSYFGLGCRSISKLWVPRHYNFEPLLQAWRSFSPIIQHHKYANNYDYQKSIMLINRTAFLDSGFVMLTESESLVSPISVVFYQTYSDQADLRAQLLTHTDKLQCVASANGWFAGSLPFGKAQMPDVWDYPDRVDTIAFLQKLEG